MNRFDTFGEKRQPVLDLPECVESRIAGVGRRAAEGVGRMPAVVVAAGENAFETRAGFAVVVEQVVKPQVAGERLDVVLGLRDRRQRVVETVAEGSPAFVDAFQAVREVIAVCAGRTDAEIVALVMEPRGDRRRAGPRSR